MVDTGDASVQMVRILLETTQVTFKFAGGVARGAVALTAAALKKYSNSKSTDKIGKNPLKRFLTNNPNSTIFSIPNEQLKDFAKAAKKYGVKYCIVEDKKGGICDVFINSEQAQIVNRIIERYEAAHVVADVQTSERTPEKENDIPVYDDSKESSESFDINFHESGTKEVEITEQEAEEILDTVLVKDDEQEIKNPSIALPEKDVRPSELKSDKGRKDKKAKSIKNRESVKSRLKRAEAKTKAKNVPKAKDLNIEKVK